MHLVKTAIRIIFCSLATIFAAGALEAKQTAGFSQIALGNNSTCALRIDYSVACFGYGTQGQMSDNRYTLRNAKPVEAQGFAHGKYLSAGQYHYCIVMSDGFVSCWGDNSKHQVSDSSMGLIGLAFDRKDLSAVQLATGGKHSCAVLQNGTAKCWGANNYGQLSDGTTSDQSLPASVVVTNPVDGSKTELANVDALAAGFLHTCAKISDGTVECWGYNGDGELGVGDMIDRSSPTKVMSLPNTVVMLATGYGHTCTVLVDGTLRCWGRNDSGQVGTGDTRNRELPIEIIDDVFPLVGVVSVAVGSAHTCVALDDGTARCWGSNAFGQLGTGNFLQQFIPMPVVDETGRTQEHITAIAAGAIHTCALIDSKVVKCWGDNTFGELGNGQSGGDMKVAYATPSEVEPTLFFGDFEN